jgi:histidyl-tRNA synthetase
MKSKKNIKKNQSKPKVSKPVKNEKKNKVAPKIAPEKKDEMKVENEKGQKLFQVLRGMHDIVPKEEKYWKATFRTAEGLAEYFQFGRIDTPVLEDAHLYIRSVGKGTDIVDKEMYLLKTKGGDQLALRPEGTAGVARAYISNGLWNNAQPVKLWYFDPLFRHERPQAGRYRQHYQIGFETLGVKDPAIDAELILAGFNIFKDLGTSIEVHINSLGTEEERVRYKAELTNYYRSKRSYLCEDCRQRLLKNPLRLLDCKEEQCQPVKENAPQIIDWLGEESKSYFMKVLEYLDELSVPYVLTPTLVRGLDYYSHTIFEFVGIIGEDRTTFSLGGGGRYDTLIEELGGKSTPAAGVGIGVERAILYLKEFENHHKVSLVKDVTYDVFFAQLGEDAKRHGLKLIDQLRGSGLKVCSHFFKNSLKVQLEQANSLHINYVLILGQKEVQDKSIIIRDMESGVQEIVDQKKLEQILKKKLELSE